MDDINHFDDSEKNNEGESRIKFKCKYCFRKMSSRQNLREHLYIHTGEMPYICTEPGCGQKFRQGSLLSTHKRIHAEVNKWKSHSIVKDQKCVFPKLTDLLSELSKSLFSSEFLDKTQIKSEIGESCYHFIKKFIP